MKYSVVLNQEVDLGSLMNALGHVSVGLACRTPTEDQAMRSFLDKDGQLVGTMSDHPLIVLVGANSAKLRQAHIAAAEAGLVCNAFVLDMKDGSPVDQTAAIQAKPANELLYLAVGCWGDADKVRTAFKRFSLFK